MPDQLDNLIIISDLDGTLTTIESSWQFVLEELGLWIGKGSKNLDLFLKRKITYDQFIDLDVALLKGIPVEDYLDVINKIPFHEGLENLFQFFKSLNVKETIIVSSGLKDVADRLAKKVSISDLYANEIHRANNYLNGNYTKKVGWDDKEMIMKQIKSQNQDSKIIAFGDTLADLPLIKMADVSFACFSSSNELINNASFTLDNLNDAIAIINEKLND